jgi:hypothetical protein
MSQVSTLKKAEDMLANVLELCVNSKHLCWTALSQARMHAHQEGILAGYRQAQEALILLEGSIVDIYGDYGDVRLTAPKLYHLLFAWLLQTSFTHQSHNAPIATNDISKVP